ncbi:MAG: ATP-binding protein, partial [Bacteroidia bacterium]
VNRGNIFRYIKKPFVESDILSAIEEAYKFYTATSLLRTKNEELKKAYSELDKFAYSVTHDLSGPTSSIAGAIDLIKDEKDIDSIHNILDLIKNSVEKLNEFILSIQDYYRINRGQLLLEKIDFNTLVYDLKSIYSVAEKIDKVRFITNINQPYEFRSDQMSIRMVLNNLLSNAFKYQRKDNPDKKVELFIDVDKHSATIRVKDNGIGIKDEYHESIFQMFFRATTEETGSGFGLFNIKDVLKKIDGIIKLESIPGEGSEFTVTLASKK